VISRPGQNAAQPHALGTVAALGGDHYQLPSDFGRPGVWEFANRDNVPRSHLLGQGRQEGSPSNHRRRRRVRRPRRPCTRLVHGRPSTARALRSRQLHPRIQRHTSGRDGHGRGVHRPIRAPRRPRHSPT
jgi:hypothetical protein